MDIKMFLPWLLLAQSIALVGSNALTTQGGSLLPSTEGTDYHYTNREPVSTERAALLTLRGGTHQTPAVTTSTDQHKRSDHLSTGEPTSPVPTEVTSGKTEPTTFDTNSTPAGEKGPTPYRSSDSAGAGRGAKDDGGTSNNQKNAFYYDYHTLRIHGLICAAILFVTGILIIACERVRCASCCRKKKTSRTYDHVTRL
ncbi:uncharacterized protein LOC144770670 [Lissotriton helveticus]